MCPRAAARARADGPACRPRPGAAAPARRVPRPHRDPPRLRRHPAPALQSRPDRPGVHESLDERRAGTYAENGSVFVEVSDSGPGVAPELGERVFEPFFTTKAVGKGTGLGLAIAHSLVARNGGDIQLQSAPGHGATFVVRLPVEPPAVVPETS
ncbi:MAG: hypothetical protein E6J75_14135 [Deltaproteobacteria bacterium]|nr:MAG: hypothetical protein E6J75_14135 [Deltaproteobacteria bacterium]